MRRGKSRFAVAQKMGISVDQGFAMLHNQSVIKNAAALVTNQAIPDGVRKKSGASKRPANDTLRIARRKLSCFMANKILRSSSPRATSRSKVLMSVSSSQPANQQLALINH